MTALLLLALMQAPAPADPIPSRPLKPGAPRRTLPAAQKPLTLKSRAIAAREAGQLPESSRLLQQHLRAQPKDPEAWWYLGLNAYDRDEYTPCAEAFSRVYALDAKNAGAAAFLGLCEFRLGQHEKSFAHLVMARQTGLIPGSELEKVAHHHYLMLLNKLGQFELAASLLANAARATPDLPFLETMCGIAALRQKLLPMEVPEDLKQPVKLAGRATLLAFQRRNSEALAAGRELLAQFPALENVNYVMGYLTLLDQSPESIPYFQKEIELHPAHVQARLQVAYEYLKRGEAAQGLPYAAEAARLAPKDFTARNIHGRLLLDLGKPQDALPELEAATRLAPNSPEAHFHLSNAYNRLDRKEDARRHREIFSRLEKERKP